MGDLLIDLPLIQLGFALIGCPVAPVRGEVPFTGCLIAPVGGDVAFAGCLIAPVGGPVPFTGRPITPVGGLVTLVCDSVAFVGCQVSHGDFRLVHFRVDVPLVGVAPANLVRGVPFGRALLPPARPGTTNLVIRHSVSVGPGNARQETCGVLNGRARP